ncbi:MAG TPA: PIN domain-containing protein [Polyangia bacterium]|nr:PIN domain-containing protein [Polyangia bacterium]
MIVLDASVLIAHLDERDAHHAKASQLLVGTGSKPLGASSISLAETLVAPARAGRLADATQALERLGVEELPLGPGAPARLAQLRADTGRKLPDCCVLLAAQEHDGAVASFDSALLDTAARLPLATLGRP